MQSKQDKNALFLVAIGSGQIITTLFHTQMQLQVNRIVSKTDIVTIEHNQNRLVTAVHKIHIVLIKCRYRKAVTIIAKRS
jgi:hypothetical protein